MVVKLSISHSQSPWLSLCSVRLGLHTPAVGSTLGSVYRRHKRQTARQWREKGFAVFSWLLFLSASLHLRNGTSSSCSQWLQSPALGELPEATLLCCLRVRYANRQYRFPRLLSLSLEGSSPKPQVGNQLLLRNLCSTRLLLQAPGFWNPE